ncbi:MAG: hypothetical protein ACFB01_09285 [Cohaesibacteraceae bacterium]
MRRYLAAIAALAAFTASPQLAHADRFSAGDIRSQSIGHTIYLAAPFGGEFPLNYRSNGRVDGDGEALGIGRWIQPRDTGRWWIDGNRLCQQFQTWYNGTPMCFDLTRTSTTTLNWLRDNGESGRARIGEAL